MRKKRDNRPDEYILTIFNNAGDENTGILLYITRVMSIINLGNSETTFRNDSLDAWIRSIRPYRVLTVAEEEKLVELSKKGDAKALNELLECNQRFLLSAARTYSRNADEILELISEGNIGLLEAVGRYKKSYGVRFLSYAVHYVRRKMLTYLRNRGVIRTRVNYEAGVFMRKVRKEWMEDNGYEMPDWILEEVMYDEFGDKVTNGKIRWKKFDVIYDEESKGEDFDANGIIDTYGHCGNGVERRFEDEDAESMVTDIIESSCKNNDEYAIIIYGYGLFGTDETSDMELSKKLGLSISDVVKIRRNALTRMKRYASGAVLKKQHCGLSVEDFLAKIE